MGIPVEAMTIVGEDKEWGRRRRTVTRVKREAIDMGIADSRLTFSLAAPAELTAASVLDKLFNSVFPHPPTLHPNSQAKQHISSLLTSTFFLSLFTYCPAYNLLPFKTMVQ